MASLFKLGDIWTCDVYNYGRIRLGKNKSDAGFNFRYIEKLEHARRVGLPPEPAAVDWLRNTSPILRKRLAHLGLIDTEVGRTLGDLLLRFKAQGGKASSIRLRENAAKKLESFFGLSTPLTDIKGPDAQAYKVWLASKAKRVAKGKESEGLGAASVSRQIVWGRTVFNLGIKWGWVVGNPFSGIRAGSQANGSRSFYVSPEITKRVVDQIQTARGRLLFALGRWGGLRMPSEVLGFRWSFINWNKWSMTFPSPKTESYAGQEARTCPVFKELQPFVVTAWDEAKRDGEESDFVFADLRASYNPNYIIRDLIEKAIRNAGLEPWPRLLSNLRATRATEVDRYFGSKCESEWIGHGADTALKHYLMILDDDWQRATGVSQGIAEKT